MLYIVYTICLPTSSILLFNSLRDRRSTEAIVPNRAYLWSRSKCWMRAHKRTFNAQRLKSQIWTMGFRCFVSFANSTNQNYLEYYLYQEHIQDCSSRNTEQCILFPFMQNENERQCDKFRYAMIYSAD